MISSASLIHELHAHNITLIAVSKNQSLERIRKVYELNVRDFGENRVQELLEKVAALPRDIRWHLIGHLQTNKVKVVLPYVHMIHSLDSIKLLDEIQKQASILNIKVAVLFQFHVAREETKFGFDPEQISQIMAINFSKDYPNVIPSGVMGMASNTDDEAQIRYEFKRLRNIFDSMRQSNYTNSEFQYLSMGMSGDYHLAIAEGSNMVRIGSLLFQDQ